MLRKVPEVTIFFWIIKIMATTVGESAADFLNVNLHLGLTITTYFMSALLAVVLVLQFRAKGYVPSIYWLTVVLISICGTLVTDNLVENLGVSLQTTTAVFGIALIAVFAAWQLSEKTLSIHSIYTTKREAFYWLAILFTFALGTAAGDLVSEGLHTGYATAGLLFAGTIGLVVLAWRYFKLNEILAFWVAYILTRPLGASLGDFLAAPPKESGIGLGAVTTSLIFLSTILAVVIYLTMTRKDQFPIEEAA